MLYGVGMPDENWQAPVDKQLAAFSHKPKVSYVSLKTGDGTGGATSTEIPLS